MSFASYKCQSVTVYDVHVDCSVHSTQFVWAAEYSSNDNMYTVHTAAVALYAPVSCLSESSYALSNFRLDMTSLAADDDVTRHVKQVYYR